MKANGRHKRGQKCIAISIPYPHERACRSLFVDFFSEIERERESTESIRQKEKRTGNYMEAPHVTPNRSFGCPEGHD